MPITNKNSIAFTRDHLTNHATADGSVTLCGSDVESHGHDPREFPVECMGCLYHLLDEACAELEGEQR